MVSLYLNRGVPLRFILSAMLIGVTVALSVLSRHVRTPDVLDINLFAKHTQSMAIFTDGQSGPGNIHVEK